MKEKTWQELIDDRIANYWGYGNLDGDRWYVGMEEGHDDDLYALRKRFENTFAR